MILGAEPKNQVIWTIHCKVMAPNLQICPNMGKIDEKRPFLSRPSVNYFKNSLKSFVIMLLTAPGVKLPSYRKNGFKASWWRCVLEDYANLINGFFPLGCDKDIFAARDLPWLNLCPSTKRKDSKGA